MTTQRPAWRGVAIAGGVACVGYAILGWHAGDPEARGWLALAQVLGWLAVAAAWWGGRDNRATRTVVVAWAVAFRLCGVGVAPSWEDDYHRYLWDGYMTVTTGDPYAEPPAAAFGRGDELPEPVAAALDGLNNPDLPTIYGPMSQAAFALGALAAPGSLTVLKLLLVAAELLGWWALRRHVGWGGWVLLWWCPLAVTEIAFTGHPEALGVAALALALAAWRSGRGLAAGVATAVATAVKPFGAVLAPFVARRWGWRAAAGLAVWVALYLPFWLQGSAGEWPALRAMSQGFEYNSTGYAVLAALLPAGAARAVAVLLVLAFATGCWWRWARGDRAALPPVAPILGVALLLAPVVNPWYALWLLPWLAVQPRAWGIGVLLAVPLAYTHGWGGVMGAGVDYTHPAWTRPLEVAVVILAAGFGRWWVARMKPADPDVGPAAPR